MPVDAATGEVAPRGVERALGRKRLKYEDEVRRLIDAARQVMATGTTDDPTVADILNEAGLSTAAFYRHFPTKEDLLLMLLSETAETTRSYVAHQISRHERGEDQVVAAVRAMFDMLRTPELLAANRPYLLARPRLLERFPDEIESITAEVTNTLQGAIVRAREEAGLPVDGSNADAWLAHRQILGILTDRAAQRRTPDSDEIDAAVSYTLRATVGTQREVGSSLESGAVPRPRRPVQTTQEVE